MADKKTERASRSGRRALFRLRSDTAESNGRELAIIAQMLDDGTDIGDIAAFVDRIRRLGDTEQCRSLDLQLLECIAGHGDARKELQAVHNKLEESIRNLTRPPFFPARYLGPVVTEDGEYASLSHEGSRRFVGYGESLGPDDLVTGDEVLLCHEQNALVAKSPISSQQTGETATLVRHTTDGRLVLSDKDTEVVVTASGLLATASLRPGDSLLWDRSALMALSRLEPGDTHGFEDIDGSSQQSLGGLDHVCAEILELFVFAIQFPDLALDYGIADDNARRMLLQGPPGNSKTSIMKMVAAKIAQATGRKCRVVVISAAELHSSYVGETESKTRRCFARVNEYDGPGIVFIDEIDAIGRARGHASGFHDDRFLNTLLAEMEGMGRSSTAIIASTNRADTLDPALRSRFSWEVEIPRPNLQAARKIFSIHMPEDILYRPNSGEAPRTRQSLIDAAVSRLYEPNTDNLVASLQFSDGKRRDVAARELVSGRLIEQICRTARAKAFHRHCKGGESGVSVGDMQIAAAEAITRLRKTLTTQNVRNFVTDLPQDLDVVSVEPFVPRIEAARYAR